MIHDPGLLERLSRLPTETFGDECFRATPKSLDPLAPSTRGGRWAPAGEIAVLYTSLLREGALAEIAFYWGQLSPLPRKHVALHRLRIRTARALRLLRVDLTALGVSEVEYSCLNYERTQSIGAAVAFLGNDGLIVPSARWACDNLMVFTDNLAVADEELGVVSTEDVDWLTWARDRDLIPPD